MAWGTNAGYAINPARDFGPRLASFLTGYEQRLARSVWPALLLGTDRGPLIGGLVGAGLYQALVGRFLPEEEEPEAGRVPPPTDYEPT